MRKEQTTKKNQARGRLSVEQGNWGEEVAATYFMQKGWRVVARNVRPCSADRRCEIDLIVKTAEGGMVFVEVKTHAVRSPYATRLAAVDRRKKQVLLRACANWILHERWHGNYRFDVLEIYGTRASGALPEIDHIENVPLFPPKWRFW